MRIAYVAAKPPVMEDAPERIITYFETPKSLTAFATNPVLKDYEHIVLELIGSKYSNPHILSAIQLLRRYVSADITVAKEDSTDTTELFGSMGNFNVTNLVTVKDEEQMRRDIADCINGKSKLNQITQIKLAAIHAINTKTAKLKLEVPRDRTIDIAVLGALPRIGATTQALGTYHYLKQLGFAPVIVDRTGFCEVFCKFEEHQIDDNALIDIRGVKFDINEHRNDPNANVNIFDIGTNIQDNMVDILSADLVIIVCGSKLNEILLLADMLPSLNAIENARIINILSFTPEGELDKMSELLRGKSYSAPYQPDMWQEHNQYYSEILYQTIKDICNTEEEN